MVCGFPKKIKRGYAPGDTRPSGARAVHAVVVRLSSAILMIASALMVDKGSSAKREKHGQESDS